MRPSSLTIHHARIARKGSGSVKVRRVRRARCVGRDTSAASFVSTTVSHFHSKLIGSIADDRTSRAVATKVAPARAPTADTISDEEVSIVDVPAPSASRAPAPRKGKGKGKAVESKGKIHAKSPEVLKHIAMENKLELSALELLQQIQEMREWRIATFGDE